MPQRIWGLPIERRAPALAYRTEGSGGQVGCAISVLLPVGSFRL